MALANFDIEEVDNDSLLTVTGTQTPSDSDLQTVKQKCDVLSGDEAELEPDLEWVETEDMMNVDPQPEAEARGPRLTSKVSQLGLKFQGSLVMGLKRKKKKLTMYPQTSVGVIKAPPNKKVKTKKVASTDGGEPHTSSAVAAGTHMGSRKSRKGLKGATNGAGSKPRSTKSDLPPHIQDDLEDKWSNVVLPSLLLWCGDQLNVWTISDGDLTGVLTTIIQHVYPLFELSQNEVKHGSAIYNLVRSHSYPHDLNPKLLLAGRPVSTSRVGVTPQEMWRLRL